MVLSGLAKDAADADRAVTIAKAIARGTSVINAMKVSQPQQIMLKVRYLEVNRNAAREIGVNWYGGNRSGTNGVNSGLGFPSQAGRGTAGLPIFEAARTFASGATGEPFSIAIASLLSQGYSLDVMISALEKRGLVRLLAEPNLVALSGDSASFHAGGEVPVFVVQPSGGNVPLITVEYKPFGVRLLFEPTVLNDGIINLRIAPEVSQLDYTNAVEVQGFRIPALSKRETKTTIELRNGQSFAISGLLQNENLRDISQVARLGSGAGRAFPLVVLSAAGNRPRRHRNAAHGRARRARPATHDAARSETAVERPGFLPQWPPRHTQEIPGLRDGGRRQQRSVWTHYRGRQRRLWRRIDMETLKLAAIAATATLLLSGAAQAGDYDWEDIWVPYVQRSDKATATSGNAQSVNSVTHVITPWPPYVLKRHIQSDGERMVGAVRRYRDPRGAGAAAAPPLTVPSIAPPFGGQSSSDTGQQGAAPDTGQPVQQ